MINAPIIFILRESEEIVKIPRDDAMIKMMMPRKFEKIILTARIIAIVKMLSLA